MINTPNTVGSTRPRGALLAATALSLIALVSGCGFVNTGGDEGGGGADGILKGFVNPAQKTGLDAVLPECEEQAGVQVELTQMSTDDLNQQLRVQLSSGTAPDFFRVSPGYSSPVAAGVLGSSGDLADISSGAWTDQVPDASRPLAEVDGTVKAFPTNSNAIVVAYNRQVFDDLGLSEPTTWSELLATSKKIDRAGTTPIAAGFVGGVAIQFPVYALAASLVYGPTPEIDEEMASGQTSFAENRAWQQVFSKFDTLAEDGLLTEDALGTPEDQAMQAVAGGDAAMMVAVSAGLPTLYDYSEQGAEGFGTFALPATDDPADTRVPIAPEFLAVNADSPQVEEAKKLLDCLAEPEHVNTFASELGSLPGLDVDDAEFPDDLAGVEPLLADDRTAPFANYMWPNGDTQQRLLQSGQQLVDQSIEVDQLCEQLDTEYAKGKP